MTRPLQAIKYRGRAIACVALVALVVGAAAAAPFVASEPPWLRSRGAKIIPTPLVYPGAAGTQGRQRPIGAAAADPTAAITPYPPARPPATVTPVPVSAGPSLISPSAPAANSDFFGIVGHDPWYEWNTDPLRFPGDVNREALEGMAREMSFAGAGWIRIELHADREGPDGPGTVDWRKWDWFIKECAPRYGLKVLLLLGQTLVARAPEAEPDWNYSRINDPPDRPDGTNRYIRLYVERAREVADHLGDSVAAYEILNEANISASMHRWTGGRQQETDPERFGALLAEVYAAIKPAHPAVPLIVGGLLFAPGETRVDAPTLTADAMYLQRLYGAERVRRHRAATGRYPFDGVAVHPYFVGSPRQIVDHLRLLHTVMIGADDSGLLWLTEVGATATPARAASRVLAATPTLGEARPFLARAFWFKYEDFRPGGGVDDDEAANAGDWTEYGLVRLPITREGAYRSPPVRKPAFAAFQEFANPGSAPTAPEAVGGLPADARYFPETRHAIVGAFREYWERHGALARFGLPTTRVFEVGGQRVQYFERARFEWHPENSPPHQVQLGLLTRYLTADRTFPSAPSKGEGRYFVETGHNLSGAFLRYWEQTGGLASYGYPLSEELREVNRIDGREYTVQYFERARFEHHPENGEGAAVLLGLMGLEALDTGGWYR